MSAGLFYEVLTHVPKCSMLSVIGFDLRLTNVTLQQFPADITIPGPMTREFKSRDVAQAPIYVIVFYSNSYFAHNRFRPLAVGCVGVC